MVCTGDPAVGVYGRMLLEPGASAHTFDANSIRLEILPQNGPAENIQKHGRLIGGQGIWGGLYPLSSRVRDGGYYVYGKFSFNPSPGYMALLLPYLVGDLNTGVYYPNDCVNPFGLLIDRDKEAWEIKDCEVAMWELTSRAPEFRETGAPDLLTLTVHVIGKDETKGTSWPGTAPSIPTGETFAPYIFQDSDSSGDGQILVNGSAREVYGFRLLYDNGLRVRYANSLVAQSIFSTGRRILLDLQLPWDANNDDLYDMGYAGAAASLDFAYSVGANDYSTHFDITNFKAPPDSPFIRDQNEVFFTVRGQAYGDASNKEFSVTNDAT